MAVNEDTIPFIPGVSVAKIQGRDRNNKVTVLPSGAILMVQ